MAELPDLVKFNPNPGLTSTVRPIYNTLNFIPNPHHKHTAHVMNVLTSH